MIKIWAYYERRRPWDLQSALGGQFFIALVIIFDFPIHVNFLIKMLLDFILGFLFLLQTHLFLMIWLGWEILTSASCKNILLFACICVYLHVSMCTLVCGCSQRPKEGVGFPGAVVVGGCILFLCVYACECGPASGSLCSAHVKQTIWP